MDYRKNNQIDPWDDGVFGTGNTMPPKSHGGIIALLLITVIFLSGIVSVLGFLNIKLFQELNQQSESTDSMPMSFSNLEETQPIVPTQPTAPLPDAFSENDVTISLNQTPKAIENIPQEGGLSWQEIYEINIDSVVSIICTTYTGSSTGTGVIVSDQGYIVTNCHVVDGAETITVQLTDERILSGVLIGADTVSDLAVLYVDADNLHPAEFGDSSQLRVGDAVAAIGDPLGTQLRGSMTNGIISAINRNVTLNGRAMTVIQTNAALNSGNSGGPLINCYGQIIGINTMKISTFADATGVEGLGFAIPSTIVKEVVDQLISQGYVSGRPTLGLEGDSISRFDQYYFRIPAGLLITDVEETSSAAEQGIEPGDILVSVDGNSIISQDALDSIIYSHNVGDSVDVIIYREGTQYGLTLTLTEAKG